MNHRLIKPLSLLCLVILASAACAQDVVKWTSHITTGTVAPNAVVTVEVDADIQPGWHLYALTKTQAGNIPTSLSAVAPAKMTGPVVEDKPIKKYDPNFEAQVEFFQDHAKFTAPVQLGPDGKGQLSVHFQTCNDKNCLLPKSVPIPIGGEASTASPPHAGSSTPAPEDQGLLTFILFAFGAGLLALLTPCVFPMVPITVSYFAKQHEKGGGSTGLGQPLAYCFGIISAFTGFGILVTVLFGASGIQRFATNPIVNLVLAALFIFLSLNLFGLYEITLPVSVTNR